MMVMESVNDKRNAYRQARRNGILGAVLGSLESSNSRDCSVNDPINESAE